MCMTLQKGTGSFITAILLTSSFMHFPHQVYSVQIFSWSKMKQGVRIKLKNNFPTVFAFFAPTIFKHDRNLKRRWKLFINNGSYTLVSYNKKCTFFPKMSRILPFITGTMHHREESIVF